jgi:HK97 family phage major capsid protein/HK97 family phage prohead protease
MKRAYSQLTIKSIDEDLRVIEGIATTPTPDRYGDIVEPDGAKYALPLPLLWQHNSREPIGHVETAKVAPDGITIKARLVKITEPGALKDRLDEAWQSLKSGLVRGLSIGFTPLESARIKDTYSERFLSWEWLELSCVVIAANADASITSIKSADQALLAASGEKQRDVVRLGSPPGASGKKVNPKGKIVQTIAEQIASFEAKRAASAARMEAIMAAAAEAGRSLDETESEEYDGLSGEVETIDSHLVRLKKHEAQILKNATPIDRTKVNDPRAASAARANSGIISVAPNVEKGVKMARFVMAQIRAGGDMRQALSIFQGEKRWMDQTPEVATVMKAAVAAGDTTTAGWASELVYAENLANEFIELLRPATVLGKIPGLTRVPFNIRIGSQTAGGSGFWVGQGKPVPVSKLTTGSTSLGIAKAAGLNVIDEELARSSSPSAELLVRNDLIKTNATFIDVQFLDPGVAAVANVSPASITSGVNPTAATGTTSATLRADVQTLFGLWIAANLDPSQGVWIMPATTALSISLMLNALGQPVFPGITMKGGEFFGLPVITSQSAVMVGSPVSGEGNMIILLNAPEILLADDGQMVITVSNQASLEMLDNPTNASTGATAATSMVSMFQTNSLAIKGIRWINWGKKRTTAVQYIKDAAYVT